MRFLRSLTALVLLATPAAVSALPAALSSTGADDDANIALSVLDASIIGDSRSPCSLEFSDAGSDVVFTDGDTIHLAVWEDDVAGDELIWELTIPVTGDLLEGGAFAGDFDCTSDFGEDGFGGELEIYAQAVVTKAECGTWCLYDRPTTANLNVTEVIDDEAEDDDTPDDGLRLLPGLTDGRALTDQDFFALILTEAARVELSILAVDAHGPVAVTLETPEGERVVEPVRGEESILFTPGAMPVGTYYLRLQPAERPDFAFYDVSLTVDVGACGDGATESEECGSCGSRSRSCVDGSWDSWSGCSDEGECAPGDSRLDDCGNCGVRSVSCSDSCAWVADECTGQGECATGDLETEECGDDGTRARECNDECAWDGFSECVERPDPDPECTSELGGTCESDDDCCDGWSCLGQPEEPWFTDGYCSSLGCESDDDCDGGICASVFGAWTCLAGCADHDDCPQPSLCLEFDDTTACAPPCESDDDCTDPDWPTCLPSGACGPDETGEDVGPDATDDVGAEDTGFERDTGTADSGPDSPAIGRPDSGSTSSSGSGSNGGCSSVPGPTNNWLLPLSLLLLLPRPRQPPLVPTQPPPTPPPKQRRQRRRGVSKGAAPLWQGFQRGSAPLVYSAGTQPGTQSSQKGQEPLAHSSQISPRSQSRLVSHPGSPQGAQVAGLTHCQQPPIAARTSKVSQVGSIMSQTTSSPSSQKPISPWQQMPPVGAQLERMRSVSPGQSKVAKQDAPASSQSLDGLAGSQVR